jgi:hypothetical protein
LTDRTTERILPALPGNEAMEPPMRLSARLCLIPLFVTAFASPALAAWPNSPLANLAVSTAAEWQQFPAIVADGSGGVIVTWQDLRSGIYDIYAQHVLASGTVDPSWPGNGRALTTGPTSQSSPAIVSDGAGGAIVTWMDFGTGTYHVYAQHVLESGAVDPAWPTDGRAMTAATSEQQAPAIVPDGAGGAIVIWYDFRHGNWDIYAQHVMASGTVDPAWPAEGRALCVANGNQNYLRVVSDDAGGAIASWQDHRSGTNYDLYAQRVLASGAVDPGWPVDGQALCTAANDQKFLAITSDGAGGAIVTWEDLRRDGWLADVYAQHVLSSGTVDPAWPVDGQTLCTAANHQINLSIVSDGAGGAIVSWNDYRSGLNNGDIYAQHVLASGAVHDSWPTDGRALCTEANEQRGPVIVSDGAGGAIVAWHDLRNGNWANANWDYYAQRIVASGVVDGTWPANGRALCTAASNQQAQAIASDGAGGAIVAWGDFRSGDCDIYAQRVTRQGYLGTSDGEPGGATDVAFALPSPNPAEVHTTLQFTLPRAGMVRLGVYDASGRLVRELAGGTREAGQYAEAWDVRDASGRAVRPGIYFARLETDGATQMRRVAVTR